LRLFDPFLGFGKTNGQMKSVKQKKKKKKKKGKTLLCELLCMSISCCWGEMICVLTTLPLASKYHPSGSLKEKGES
jgi:hypothetical protein